MAMEDLYTALNMFQHGAQQLAMGNAINHANDQVQQIKASQMDDMQQRSALQNLSNGLVAHLAAGGTPATTIQAIQGALGPRQYADADDMNKQALLTGNKRLGALAESQQEFENNNDAKLEEIRAKAEAQRQARDPLRNLAIQNALDDKASKGLDKIFHDANPNVVARGALGILQKKINMMQEVNPLTQDPNITRQQLAELPQVLNAALSNGGVGNVAGQEHLSANTANQGIAALQELLTSDPQAVKLPKFQAMYKDTIDRVNAIAQSQIDEGVKTTLKTASRHAGRLPDVFNNGAKALLPNDPVVSVDSKKGITFQSDLDQQLLKDSVQHVMQNKDKLGANAPIVLKRMMEDKPAAWDVNMRTNPKFRAFVNKIMGDGGAK